LIAGVPSPAPAGLIPATSTKVSESPDCDNSSLEAAYRAVWAAFSSGLVSPTRDPFQLVLPEMLVNILIKFSSSGKLRTTSPKGRRFTLYDLLTK